MATSQNRKKKKKNNGTDYLTTKSFNKWNILKFSLFSFTIFFDLEEIIFENYFEKNVISAELAKILGYFDTRVPVITHCLNIW